jgi:hypothetical protein
MTKTEIEFITELGILCDIYARRLNKKDILKIISLFTIRAVDKYGEKPDYDHTN